MLLSLIIEMKISELFENYGAEAHTAMELAKELNQDINDLSEILASKSTISAGHPHNINSLRKECENTLHEYQNLVAKISGNTTSYIDRVNPSNPYLNKLIKIGRAHV